MSLKVEAISKSFGDRLIFDNLSFSVEKGETVSLQGKSGEGKTTMLRCINALITLDRGSVWVEGRALCEDDGKRSVYAKKKEFKEIRKDLGFVFQSFHLFPHLSVKENLFQGPLFHKTMDKKQMEEKAAEWLSDLDLKGTENLYPFQLSGGQKQRVAIARACMLHPKVLSLDEPTSALDEGTISQLETVISSLKKKKMAILIVTHDSKFAKNCSDRILRFEDGILKEERINRIS